MRRIIILGAGLTGLNLARLLQKAGAEVLVLEARERSGGRIFTKKSVADTKVEMGATWLGPQHTHLHALLSELQIPVFEQYMAGASYFEPFSTSPPQKVNLPGESPSYRVVGGTSQLTDKLERSLHPDTVQFNQCVERVVFKESEVEVFTTKASFRGSQVISTLPPALLMSSIVFDPMLPKELVEVATNTQTWMRDSIKSATIYKAPFWRSKDLSGTLFSNVGPLTEYYDHTAFDQSGFALKGFTNSAFSTLTPSAREQRIKEQLLRCFGPDGAAYLQYEEVVWSEERFTTGQDQADLFPHQNNGHILFQESLMNGQLRIAGSETSPHHGGYMEGAVYSSNSVFESLKKSV